MKFIFTVLFNILIFFDLGFAQSVYSNFEFKNVPEKILTPIVKANPELFEKRPTPYQMDRILEVLYGTGEFESLEISTRGDQVVVNASPLKIIANISLRGVNRLSE